MAQGIVTFMKYLAMVLVRGISVENTDNLKFEYNAILEQISKITQIMLGWRTIAVAAAIVLPSAGKYIQITTSSPDYYLSFGYFGAAVLILWYFIDISYDRQIVKDYYPKVRELETKLKIEVYRDAWHETKWNLFRSLYKRKRYINLGVLGFYGVVVWVFACVLD